ncbi:hypothetical protein CCACVL1_18079 [Corchorus capsularis]|uniref:Uncharacterized protein n=1 Tax=Corchorus capsularis TaxID=210143 RepID=A0A1R3HN86_COCAP|nr:hypothetical protein CCACVL1_18079 [Corchorus capsularis]
MAQLTARVKETPSAAWVAGLGFPSSLGYHRRCLHLSYHRHSHLIQADVTIRFPIPYLKIEKSIISAGTTRPIGKQILSAWGAA